MVKGIKGVHQIVESTSASASGVTRTQVLLTGVTRLKSISIRNRDAVVLERTRMFLQARNVRTFDPNTANESVFSAESDQDLDAVQPYGEDKILRGQWLVVSEVEHAAGHTHVLSVMYDRLDEGPDRTGGIPVPESKDVRRKDVQLEPSQQLAPLRV